MQLHTEKTQVRGWDLQPFCSGWGDSANHWTTVLSVNATCLCQKKNSYSFQIKGHRLLKISCLKTFFLLCFPPFFRTCWNLKHTLLEIRLNWKFTDISPTSVTHKSQKQSMQRRKQKSGLDFCFRLCIDSPLKHVESPRKTQESQQ